MSAPSIVRVYPADADTGIPVGETLAVYFDRGVDLKTVSDSIVLYGNDSDQTSGPDNAIWIDGDTGNNTLFLSSPGFKGLVPLKFELVYWDTTDLVTYAELSPQPTPVTAETDETAGNYGTKVKITVDPKFGATLAPDTQYVLYINGDPDSTDTGVSARTLFDVEADGGNAGSGAAVLYGTYTSTSADIMVVEITDTGNIGTSEYKWYWDSAGVGTAVTDRITNRRYRTLDEGLQLRFTGSDLQAGDIWRANVEPVERMATSTSATFTTNDGSYTDAPASPSTPASSSPPSTVLPSVSTPFQVDYMTPLDGAYNIDPDKRVITIVFTDDLDAGTVTDESVTLWKYPVEGYYGGTFEPLELEKSLAVAGDTLTIRF